MKPTVSSADWSQWFQHCTFERCDPESRERFNQFCRSRLEKALRQKLSIENARRAHSGRPAISLDIRLHTRHPGDPKASVWYPSLHEVDAWALSPAPQNLAGKSKKDWLHELESSPAQPSSAQQALEGRLTRCIQTDIARAYLRENFSHETSLDKPVGELGSPDSITMGATIEDPHSAGGSKTGKVGLKELAEQSVDEMLGSINPIDRVIFACGLRQIPLNTPSLIVAVNRRKSVIYERWAAFRPLLENQAARALNAFEKSDIEPLVAEMLRIWVLRDLERFPPENPPWASFNQQ